MNQEFNFLYQYLEKEELSIDKTEFEFQIKSHPNYPSLLSITDTLSFFNIQNGAIHVDTSDIELLPDSFVTLLNEENKKNELYLIEKRDENYVYTKDENIIKISKSELELKWNGVVLLIETKTENIQYSNKNKWHWTLPISCLILFLLTIFKFDENITTKLFFIFPIIGILFSVAALKDLFGTNSKLINSFCNITMSTSCISIVGSNKWKIFEFINFSDLSIIFFTSQFLGQIAFLLMGNTISFFSIQKVLFLSAIPILFISLYYQKFVVQKWCPICLAIIFIILLELGYLLFLHQTIFNFTIQSIIVFGFIFVTVVMVWFILKKLLTQQKELKEFQVKSNRFMRNYEIFKNTLIVSNPIQNTPIHSGVILLGNANASLKITVITSPFCSFCAEAHIIIEEILEKYPKTVCFDIRFNFNGAHSDEKSKKIHQQLVTIYFNYGQETFIKAFHSWFENRDETKLNNLTNTGIKELKTNLILEEQYNWNQENDLNFTPAIIIHGYTFPKQYDRHQLIHFINDLSEDEDFE